MRRLLALVAATSLAALATSAAAQTATTTTVTQKPSEGAAVGVVGGAATGAALGGPVGAVVGAVAGGIAGSVVDPPKEVTTYVQSQTVPVVTWDGEVVVGSTLPGTIGVYDIPNHAEYSWANINGQRVLIERSSRKVVSVTPGSTAVTARTGSATAAAGLVGGAATGAAVGGPVGAAVGAVVGGVAGALADPPKEVTTYVRNQTVPAARYDGQIVVGQAFPSGVGVYDIPSDPRYRWSYVNGQRVLIDGRTNAVVTVLP